MFSTDMSALNRRFRARVEERADRERRATEIENPQEAVASAVKREVKRTEIREHKDDD